MRRRGRPGGTALCAEDFSHSAGRPNKMRRPIKFQARTRGGLRPPAVGGLRPLFNFLGGIFYRRILLGRAQRPALIKYRLKFYISFYFTMIYKYISYIQLLIQVSVSVIKKKAVQTRQRVAQIFLIFSRVRKYTVLLDCFSYLNFLALLSNRRIYYQLI